MFVYFPLLLLRILSLSLIFVSLITICLSEFYGFILPGTLCFLDMVDYFLSSAGEVFSYYLLKYFLGSFLSPSSPSGTLKMWILVHLMLSQRSVRLSSFLFILFSVFCFATLISTILSSRLLISSSASVILLLIPSSVLFLKRSLVFPILLFSSISLHWLLRKAFLSRLAILWSSAFRCLYLSFSPVLFASCTEELMLLNCDVGEDSWESLGLQGDPTSPS